MTDLTPPHEVGLSETAAGLRAGSITSEQLTSELLDRIGTLDPQLHAFRDVFHDEAITAARALDADLADGVDHGPLHGIPVAVKDALLAGADGAAAVVGKLRAAGAVVIGSVQTADGPWFDGSPSLPVPVNPWDAAQSPGTSCSGAGVAVAAGLCPAVVTTDTGGAIRLPSAANGVTGLKPTAGRVSVAGAIPVAQSLDHIGPVCRTAADVATVLSVLAGHDDSDLSSVSAAVPDYRSVLDGSVENLRIGVDPSCRDGVDAESALALDAAVRLFAGLGAQVEEVAVPHGRDVSDTWTAVAAVEAALSHVARMPAQHSGHDPLSRLLDQARSISGTDMVLAQRARARLRQDVTAAFDRVDVLLVPVQPTAGFTITDHERMLEADGDLDAHVEYVLPFNLTGHPALSLPCGVGRSGVPLAMQLVSRPLAESLLLRAAHAYQLATDWHLRRPSL